MQNSFGTTDRQLIHDAIERMDRPDVPRLPDVAFTGPEEKLGWAYENIESASHLFEEFLASKPVELVEAIDVVTGNKHFQLKATRPLPREIPRLVGYAIYDLRSALEHTAIIAARKNGCTELRRIKFPFAKSDGELNDMLDKGKSALRPLVGDEFADFLIAERPYPGGNDFLWGFGRLSNHDRHIEIIPIGNAATPTAFGDIRSIGGSDGPRPGTAGIVFGNPGDLQHGITVSIGGPDATFTSTDGGEPNIGIASELCFRDTEAFEGKSVLNTLYEAHGLVPDIILRARALLSGQRRAGTYRPNGDICA